MFGAGCLDECAASLACNKSNGYVSTVAVAPASAPATNLVRTSPTGGDLSSSPLCFPTASLSARTSNAAASAALYALNVPNVVALYGNIRTTAA
jgi:hypothetical protein